MPFSEIIGPGKFAHGLSSYIDRFGKDQNTRIVVFVRFKNAHFTAAIVDTGAPWCIWNPEEAEALDLDNADYYEEQNLHIRGINYSGGLYRIPVSLEAEEGSGIEATVFVPRLKPDEEWLHPNFLGLSGFLNRIRFAIDPENNHFYFASLGDEGDVS
jgi:hypothetical protein